jgi:hypothetical protein
VTTDLIRYRDLVGDLGRGALQTRFARGELRRASRGIYTSATMIDDSDRLRALFLRLPPGSVLGFHSAAARHGLDIRPSREMHVIVPPGRATPRIRGVIAHEAVLAVPAPVSVDGVPCAPPARCVVDLARTVRRMDALPVIDAALRVGACNPDELLAEAERHRGLRGIRQARNLIPFGDGRAECRQESQLRLVIIDGRLPVPEPQVVVGDDAHPRRYRIDLGYRLLKVGLEYDGVSHMERAQLRHDRARMNWLASRGWIMRYFTDVDLYQRRSRLVDTIRAALTR